MHEQEMQFASPDWQPSAHVPSDEQTVPMMVNAERHVHEEQQNELGEQHLSELSYQRGYQGLSPVPQAYQSAPGMRLSARRPLWPWVAMIIVLAALIPLLFGALALLGKPQAEFTHQYSPLNARNHPFLQGNRAFQGANVGSEASLHAYSYDMTHISTVNIDDPSGSIQVHGGLPGTEGQIEALSDSAGTGPLHFLQDNNGALTIQITQPTNGSAVLLNLVIPQNIALHVVARDGNIEVDGTSGSLNLQATRSILLNNENISGQSTITSLGGRVQIANSALSGQYTVTSSHGAVTLPQVALNGQGHIQAQDGGALIMGGTLDPQGSYTFSTIGGEITLVLPDSTALHLRVQQGSGDLTSDFPVNAGSGAQVTVETESGSIQIRKVP